MTKAFISMIALLYTLTCLALIPYTASAATYFYVDVDGVLRDIEASDAYTALTLATNRMDDSGLMLDLGDIEPGLVSEQPVDAIGGPSTLTSGAYEALYGGNSMGGGSDWGYWSSSRLPTMNWNGLMPGMWSGSFPVAGY